MPRDAVSRSANVERTGRHKWVLCKLSADIVYLWYNYLCNLSSQIICRYKLSLQIIFDINRVIFILFWKIGQKNSLLFLFSCFLINKYFPCPGQFEQRNPGGVWAATDCSDRGKGCDPRQCLHSGVKEVQVGNDYILKQTFLFSLKMHLYFYECLKCLFFF